MIPYDPHGQVKHYLNDPAGNRLKTRIVEHEAAQAGTPDAQGEWSREGEYEDVFYRFDRAGNLIDRHDRRGALHLRWDANQRLIESRLEGVSTRYRYDPLGRRIEKRSGDQITAFAWDGDALVGDWIEDPTDPVVPAKGMAREWVYYPETFEPLALLGGRSGPNTLLHYHNDPNGCPIRLTDSKGEVLWAASYTAWGQIARLYVGYVDNPIRLQGQYEDGETGFHYSRHRYFAPTIGQFISSDPLRLYAGPNIFEFAPNANSWSDPLGLACGPAVTRDAAGRWRDARGRFARAPAAITNGSPHLSGHAKPPLSGQPPNSIYTHMDPKTGNAVQNAIYDANGNVVAHVDFKNHGPGAPSGHGHVFPVPGDPSSGHGKGKPHIPPANIPPEWQQLPSGVNPARPIGT
ncbi:RHS repeat domain-containing protein [Methylocaldum szegediense]|uniref:RHS protein conserved region domain-containing protein n=1 Tax=Methylocaldum szegediense TaxID=73780 RepID=A0ABM9I381_9GAMM|nr:RHS repeat-associated core domain-containing protein [Methylocaldum szegediense]CAI8862628.1 protein of unknown function [Methylocaldum szegediense]